MGGFGQEVGQVSAVDCVLAFYAGGEKRVASRCEAAGEVGQEVNGGQGEDGFVFGQDVGAISMPGGRSRGMGAFLSGCVWHGWR